MYFRSTATVTKLFIDSIHLVQLAAYLIKLAVRPVVKHQVEHRHHASALLSILPSRRFRASVLALNASTISRAAFAVRSSMILLVSPSALSLAPRAPAAPGSPGVRGVVVNVGDALPQLTCGAGWVRGSVEAGRWSRRNQSGRLNYGNMAGRGMKRGEPAWLRRRRQRRQRRCRQGGLRGAELPGMPA